ncbi:MAG: hypothetical protein ACLSHW_07640 [Lachnospiraceae bacterium]
MVVMMMVVHDRGRGHRIATFIIVVVMMIVLHDRGHAAVALHSSIVVVMMQQGDAP